MTQRMTSDVYPTAPGGNVDIYTTTVVPNRMHRLSWSAIFAGVVIALITMFALQMFGLAIGAATINPKFEVNPVEPALGTGAVIWLVASNLIALFLGGYVAGHFAASPSEEDGVFHGLVTWGAVTLLTLAMLTSSIAGMVNGVVNAASNVIGMAGMAVAEASPEVADALNLQDMTLQGIQGEIRSLLQQSNDPALQSNPSTDGTDATGQTASNTTSQFSSLSELELNRGFSQLFAGDTVDETQRQEFITLLTERTGMTQEEATTTVERWETTFTQIRAEAEDTAREVSQAIADATTALAGALFASMLLGAFAAGSGGLIGSPERERERKIEAATSAS
jgi:hypothetical protein